MEQNSSTNYRLQSRLLIAASVLLVVSLIYGLYSGYKLGQSRATYQSVSNIYGALQYYQKDQSRYPSADEFYNQAVLVSSGYLKSIPTPNDVNGICKSYPKFIYSQTSPQHFNLQFCLTSGAGGFGAGVHVITDQGAK